MKEPNIPAWTIGAPMPDETAQKLKYEVRKLRRRQKLPASPEAEEAFVVALTPLVHDFSKEESERKLEQTCKTLLTQKHPTRKKQRPKTEHAAEELKVAKNSLIAAIAALIDGLNKTAASRLEQALFERVGDLEHLGRFMPLKRLPNGRRAVYADCAAVWGHELVAWRPLPETYEEAVQATSEMWRHEIPTIHNVCALLWAVVDIIDPSASPSQWDAKEGLEAQARKRGAPTKPLQERFMLDVGRELRKAIGRTPGGPAIKKILELIFGDKELTWNAQDAAKMLRQEPWPEE